MDELFTGWMRKPSSGVRWQHPRRGLLGPVEFIALAEETGLILPIGQWILREACRQLKAWHQAYPHLSHVTVSVNLSGQQLYRPSLVDDVAQALQEAELSPHHLVLEITESVLVQSTDAVLTRMRELKGLGVHLAIDDFGTGYSGLSYLSYLPVDIVKIDRTFVLGSRSSDKASALLRGIVDLASNLQLQIVTEGIEVEDLLSRARNVGCHLGQGYFLSRPKDPDTVAAFLQEHNQPDTTTTRR